MLMFFGTSISLRRYKLSTKGNHNMRLKGVKSLSSFHQSLLFCTQTWFYLSIKSHRSLPHYHHCHFPRQSVQGLMSVRVCESLWSTQEGRVNDLARIWTAALISQSQTEQERRSPLTERIKYPWVGTSQLPLTPPNPPPQSLVPVLPSSCRLPWLSVSFPRGRRVRRASRARKRRGEKKVKARLCSFKNQEDIWVQDFESFTHTSQSLDRSELCLQALCLCVY